MKRKKKTLEYWLPRAFSIFYIIFVSAFALDVFTEFSGIAMLIALFIHLIPSILLTIILFIAWNFEILGGFLFILFSLVVTFYFKLYDKFIEIFVVTLPISVMGLLFLIPHWKEISRRLAKFYRKLKKKINS